MSSFARKTRRKNLKILKRDVDYSSSVGTKAKAAVRHATTEQIIRDHGVVSEAYDNLMTIFDAAVHKSFGWGKKMRTRLHAKMARHLLCLKGRMVTTPDIEQILRDEAGLDLDKCFKDAGGWTHNRRLQYTAMNDMSAIFLLSLMDEFGYKKVRLSRVYNVAADIAHEISTGAVEWADVRRELEVAR